MVLDNYATHKTSEVKTWLEKHTRFKLHFTTTSASWMNLVERFFAEITTKRIRRGSYSSVDELEAVIYDYLRQHNAKPKPFVWSKAAEDILTRERRALNELDRDCQLDGSSMRRPPGMFVSGGHFERIVVPQAEGIGSCMAV